MLPSVVTFNATISACARASRWEVSLALLEEMPKRQVLRDGEGWLALHSLGTIYVNIYVNIYDV